MSDETIINIANELGEIRNVQGSNGNWNFDSYMHGLYNGIEWALAMVEERSPEFKETPEKWLCSDGILPERLEEATSEPHPETHRDAFRTLAKGEFTRVGDWFFDDYDIREEFHQWCQVKVGCGRPAPDPTKISHTVYHRLKDVE